MWDTTWFPDRTHTDNTLVLSFIVFLSKFNALLELDSLFHMQN